MLRGHALAGIRVAVTGASGFCGGEVAKAAAAAGADVVCLGRRPGPVGRHVFWNASQDTPRLGGAEIVIHLAAAVGDTRDTASARAAFHAVNVDGSERLLDAARDRPVVWVSSASVYDPGIDRRRVREDHPVGGHLNVYGASKAAGDRLALERGAVVLRPRAVYGHGDPHLLPRIRRCVRGGRALLPGPDVLLSLTSVINLADACLAAFRWPAGAYNITDAAPYPRDATIQAVLAAIGLPVRVVHVPLRLAIAAGRIGEALLTSESTLTPYAVDQVAHSVVLDVSKAAEQGWRPRYQLGDYLSDLVRG